MAGSAYILQVSNLGGQIRTVRFFLDVNSHFAQIREKLKQLRPSGASPGITPSRQRRITRVFRAFGLPLNLYTQTYLTYPTQQTRSTTPV